MNILVPDSWLREFLKTKATPVQIKEYLSLCGPSVERIHKKGGDTIYDIEITGNRPDAMSIFGIAREAAAILPRFGITAKLINDPYLLTGVSLQGKLELTIKTNPTLNPRWTSIVLINVKVGPSPSWLVKRLEQSGMRSVNNVVDTTNYLMRAYGQPMHAFDYDEIHSHAMTLRESVKGEKIVTLDGKTHKLPGGDIIITDGDRRLIDLCGIMGGYNSSIKQTTSRVVLFTQTYDPEHIRKTSMALALRTEAAGLFEKGLDTELTLPALIKGIEFLKEISGATVASKLYDYNPKPYKQYAVTLPKEKLSSYMGFEIEGVSNILDSLGFQIRKGNKIFVPSWRRDVTIDVDVIEEIARMYGYHNIKNTLPTSEPPMVIPDAMLRLEEDMKIRLRDWGFTEVYTYSMISEKVMEQFGFDKHKTYKITNPLSDDWVYMRPSLLPGMALAIKENLKHTQDLKFFELSMIYKFRKNDLPLEIPSLIVAWTGNKYREAKGIAETLLLNAKISQLDGITFLEAHVVPQNKTKQFVPIPKFPPIIEDFSFIVPSDFQVGPCIEVLSKVHKLIHKVILIDAYENKRTFRVTYLDTTRTLTSVDVAPVHQKILEYAAEKFGISPVIV